MYHGIDTTLFDPDATIPDALLARHGLVPGRFLLYVGALERRKNVERLVQAYLLAAGDRADLSLVVSGPSLHALPVLKAASNDGTGRVRYIGYVTDWDLPGLYRAARALFTWPGRRGSASSSGGDGLRDAGRGPPALGDRRGRRARGPPRRRGGRGRHRGRDRRISSDDALHAQLGQAGRARAARFTWQRCAEQTLHVYQEAYRAWSQELRRSRR